MVARRDLSVGIVGSGAIGGAVALRLLASGRRVIAWARRPAALTDLVARGAIAARSLREVADADIIISVVFDDEATREVALGPAGFIYASVEHGDGSRRVCKVVQPSGDIPAVA